MRLISTMPASLWSASELSGHGGKRLVEGEIHESMRGSPRHPAALRRICNLAEIRAPPEFPRTFQFSD
jgi:hypothetical protein